MKKSHEKFVPTQEDINAAETQIIEQSKRIEFYLTEYSVEMLAMKVSNGDFVIPAYQREFTWEPERKSKFIESLLMGLPIPFLFFWEMSDGKWEIVDGSQRLRTIKEFIYDNFVLGNLEGLTLLSGFSFSDLPESRQRKFKNRSIRGIILNEHADDEARFDLFERINTGSKIANKAEIRRGALNGSFMDLIIELAQDPTFKTMAPLSKDLENQRVREELVTRFFAYGDGLENYKDRPSQFIFKYVDAMNKRFIEFPDLAISYKQRFMDTMTFINKTFPHGFRRTASKNANATPKSRFEAISIGSWLAIKERPDIINTNVDVSAWHLGKEFGEEIGADGANVKSKLVGRINFVKERLLGLK